jgi:hypothetical protein
MGLKAGIDAVEKRKNIFLLRGIEPQPPSPLLYRLSYPGTGEVNRNYKYLQIRTALNLSQ